MTAARDQNRRGRSGWSAKRRSRPGAPRRGSPPSRPAAGAGGLPSWPAGAGPAPGTSLRPGGPRWWCPGQGGASPSCGAALAPGPGALLQRLAERAQDGGASWPGGGRGAGPARHLRRRRPTFARRVASPPRPGPPRGGVVTGLGAGPAAGGSAWSTGPGSTRARSTGDRAGGRRPTGVRSCRRPPRTNAEVSVTRLGRAGAARRGTRRHHHFPRESEPRGGALVAQGSGRCGVGCTSTATRRSAAITRSYSARSSCTHPGGGVDLAAAGAGARRRRAGQRVVRAAQLGGALDRDPRPPRPPQQGGPGGLAQVIELVRAAPAHEGRHRLPPIGWGTTPALTTVDCRVPLGRMVDTVASPWSRATRLRTSSINATAAQRTPAREQPIRNRLLALPDLVRGAVAGPG